MEKKEQEQEKKELLLLRGDATLWEHQRHPHPLRLVQEKQQLLPAKRRG
jgi:hypothetical protein